MTTGCSRPSRIASPTNSQAKCGVNGYEPLDLDLSAFVLERRYSSTEWMSSRISFERRTDENQQAKGNFDLLEHAKNVTKPNDVMVARLGYRVMEEIAERVPGVTYKTSRTLCVDDAMGVGGHHIEITFAHPDLAGWMRTHEANAGGNGGL
ncbi:hypothetical protein [Haladaptatus sp. DFWS20]|uniref:hypothetical protein n=1 Tax=Haladaptatus sp. DFWS20 TaxID=3403467 RepID=UPI003EBE7466